MTAKRAKRAPRLSFEVTTEHMAGAVPKDSGHCMIADALMEAYPNATSVAVDLATIRFTDRTVGRRYIYFTPLAAQHALLTFDAGIMPEPFRINANAAQITESVSASRKRRAQGDLKPAGQATKLVPATPDASTGSLPAKDGGRPIPIGPLAGGPGVQQQLAKEEKAAAELAAQDPEAAATAAAARAEGKKLPPGSAFRTGRRRQFGLRLMGR